MRTARQRLPPLRLPVLYYALAHLSLAIALTAASLDPAGLAGFFYHPRALALVHLVTLGWISSSILGSLYLLAPLALRTHLAAGRLDAVAFGAWVIGVPGVASHFWINEYAGMVGSAVLAIFALAVVSLRVVHALRAARIPVGVKLHFYLALGNIVAAGILGAMIGLDKYGVDVLPGYILDNVFAHAHLATVGWATLMVIGAGYRLLPMFLPAAMPRGHLLTVGGLVLEAGLLTLVFGLMAASSWARVGAVIVVIGLGIFASRVAWMLRNPRPAPKDLQRPDIGMLQARQAFLYLAVATLLGLALAFMPRSQLELRLYMVYGVVGLLGFLGQLVLGISDRLLPMVVWMHGFVGSGFRVEPPSQYRMGSRSLQGARLALWTLGVPLLAIGLGVDGLALISAGSGCLLTGVVLNAVNEIRILRHARATSCRVEEDG